MPEQKINYGFMVLAACVAAIFLFAGIAEAPRADHVCDGESCPVCCAAQHAQNLFRQLRCVCARLALPMAVFLLSVFILKQFFYYIPVSSVALKIKMNT
jgi:hypothetical protein